VPQVLHNDQWGTVCDDGFTGPAVHPSSTTKSCFLLTICTDREAATVCRSLGASTGRQVQAFGGGSGPIWLDDVVCPVNFNGFIGNCGHLPWGSHNCGHHEDIGVCCS
jgi:hypothetical protein